jgi:hypothetical protein
VPSACGEVPAEAGAMDNRIRIMRAAVDFARRTFRQFMVTSLLGNSNVYGLYRIK